MQQNSQSANLLRALINLKNAGYPNLQQIYKSGNRINSAGEALEYYIKDMFTNTFNLDKAEDKDNVYRQHFSWLGNQNNPPDFILAGSDAVEVKKTVGLANGLALNSSSPKDYLYSDDPRIVRACKDCEDNIGSWDKKDFMYAVGATDEDRIISLWIVYGNCYAADKEVYARISRGLTKGIGDIKDIEFGETNELARVNKVDPLGITDLRVRGMWGIKSPHKVFNYLPNSTDYQQPKFRVLMLKEKFDALNDALTEDEASSLKGACAINEVEIVDPNNPAQKLKAMFLYGDLQKLSELS